MGGAARRPANSGIGAIVPNRSNIFYQKLLNRTSSGGGKEKGLKGKRNCRRLRFLLVPLSFDFAQDKSAGLALHHISSGLASLGLRLPEKFSLKGKGELFIVFLAPPARARKTFLLPKPTWPFSTILAKFKLEN